MLTLILATISAMFVAPGSAKVPVILNEAPQARSEGPMLFARATKNSNEDHH